MSIWWIETVVSKSNRHLKWSVNRPYLRLSIFLRRVSCFTIFLKIHEKVANSNIDHFCFDIIRYQVYLQYAWRLAHKEPKNKYFSVVGPWTSALLLFANVEVRQWKGKLMRQISSWNQSRSAYTLVFSRPKADREKCFLLPFQTISAELRSIMQMENNAGREMLCQSLNPRETALLFMFKHATYL